MGFIAKISVHKKLLILKLKIKQHTREQNCYNIFVLI